VVSQATRSQAANRAAAIERFAELVRGALRREKPRAPTRVSRAEKARRLESKRRRSRLKRNRVAGADD
jgi:ribosome-associated protein